MCSKDPTCYCLTSRDSRISTTSSICWWRRLGTTTSISPRSKNKTPGGCRQRKARWRDKTRRMTTTTTNRCRKRARSGGNQQPRRRWRRRTSRSSSKTTSSLDSRKSTWRTTPKNITRSLRPSQFKMMASKVHKVPSYFRSSPWSLMAKLTHSRPMTSGSTSNTMGWTTRAKRMP